MTLIIGTRLGPYEITGTLGAGGMGEVYRAHDARLGRDVALKVLPELFATDAERLARFQREAQVLAALKHPNIGAIYGLEEGPAEAGPHIRALVLELIDGDTLADLIAARTLSGPRGLPLDEALPIAKQIAEALEAAHEQGVTHRDLKPSNIKITPDGLVKVLDFGLAKLTDSAGGGQQAAGSVPLSMSPTITSPAATALGVILGTAAYMAPEQAKGRPADKRSDVWAFGCVLYEMLTGRRAFEGDDVSDTLASVLKGEPDWKALPDDLPASIRTLIRACLEKDRRQRLADIAGALFVLTRQADLATPVAAPKLLPEARPPLWRRMLPAVATAAVAVAATAYVARSPVQETARMMFSGNPPDGMAFSTATQTSSAPTISPDGRRLVFVVRGPDGRNVLVVRSLDSLEGRVLQGTAGSNLPFWSPDSRAVAFFADGQLKKVDVAGGVPQTLCPAVDAAAGGSWSRDGTILFTGPTGALVKVNADGGEPVAVTTLDASQKETSHRAPWFLPDGKRFLYFAQPSNAVFLTSLDSNERKLLLRADSKTLYAPPGFLLFMRGNALMAQAFDADRAAPAGDAFRVADNVVLNAGSARSTFSVSDTGVLAYRTGSGFAANQPVWFDRSGKPLGSVGEEAQYRQVALAPDGTKAALTKYDERGVPSLWLLDLRRAVSTRFTFDRADDPVWSLDSRSLVFERNAGRFQLYRKLIDGGEEALIWEGTGLRYPDSFSPDGRLLTYHDGRTIGMVPLTGDAKMYPWLETPSSKDEPHFSPDGRWIAYNSNESGQVDVYVQAFPGPGQKVRISTDGGGAPRWRADGRELFYLKPDGMLMAASVNAGTTFEAGIPKPLFQTPIADVQLASTSTT